MRRAPMWLLALNVTLIMQISSAFLAQSMAVLGPTLTDAAGVAPERIGYLSALISLGTLWFLASGHVLLARWGSVRVLQLGGVLGAVAVLLALSGSWSAMSVAALGMGLAYGPAPPAGSDILMRHAPRERRALIFSIKQAGAPFGSAAAGLMLPAIAAVWGWRWALVATAAVSALSSVLVEPWRATIDVERRAGGHRAVLAELFSPRAVILPFRVIAARRGLLWLSCTGFSFACVQGCLFSFYDTYLTSLGVSLAAAGTAFAVLQAVGMVARVAMGFLADRMGSAIYTLILLGAGSSLAAVLAAALSFALPWPLVLAVSGVIGFIGVSWNGVFLAEVARLAPEGRVGEVTSGATLLTFLGYVVGPAAFSELVPLLGGYGACFLAVAVLPLISAAVLQRVRAISEEPAR